jgi:CBS domain-containing protein
MKVGKMMHKGVQWVSPDTSVKALATKMRRYDVGAIPIGQNDRLVGMVTDRDIAVRAVANGKRDVSKLKAKDVMTKGVVWCRDTDDAGRAAKLMRAKRIRRLPVINAKKRMVGMLSLGDIAHYAPKTLAAEVTKAVSGHHR